MAQNVHEANVNSARHLSLWLAAIAFFLFALGTLVFSWFPAEGAFEFTLQTLGPILIAVSLLVDWRTNVARSGCPTCSAQKPGHRDCNTARLLHDRHRDYLWRHRCLPGDAPQRDST